MSTRDEMRDAHPHAALLEVSGLTMRFGGLLAVDQVSLAVGRHEIFGQDHGVQLHQRLLQAQQRAHPAR